MIEKEKEMQLPKVTLDDLFSSQEDRDNKNQDKIVAIPIKNIKDFPNHPYKVIDNDAMYDMSQSIKENGLIHPVIVREKDDGTYEMISGHRRKRATELAGISEINAVIKNLSDEEAIILMVDSNDKQREEILPSEKAFAYKMKLEAIKRQAGRPSKENNAPVVQNSNKLSRDIIAEESNVSGEQIRRYVRLTELIPEILEMVDDKKIAFRPAVEISYLSHDNQYVLLDIMQFSEITPSLAQAIHLKKLEQDGKLDTDKLEEIMSQEKPNQVEKLKINQERFEKVFPKHVVSNKDREDFLYMCAEEHNQRELQKKKNRDMGR